MLTLVFSATPRFCFLMNFFNVVDFLSYICKSGAFFFSL